jgi:hypothetical protein
MSPTTCRPPAGSTPWQHIGQHGCRSRPEGEAHRRLDRIAADAGRTGLGNHHTALDRQDVEPAARAGWRQPGEGSVAEPEQRWAHSSTKR